MPRARWTLRPGHSQVPQKNMLKQGVTEKCVRVYGAGGGGRRRHINLLVTSVRRLCTFGKVEKKRKKKEEGERSSFQHHRVPASRGIRDEEGRSARRLQPYVGRSRSGRRNAAASVSWVNIHQHKPTFITSHQNKDSSFTGVEKKQESLFFSLSVDVNAFVCCCCNFFHQFSIYDFLHFFCPRHHLESPITMTVTGVSRLPSNWCLEVGNYMFL